MKNDFQILYINIDDSGKLSTKEKICVYGGLLFFSKKEKDKFITQYRSIIDDMKCKYCDNKNNCNNKCPELKHSNLKANDLRRLRNYIKKYMLFACVIKNSEIYSHIISDKSSKGRFLDYSLRRLIRGIISKLIDENIIFSSNNLNIVINIDEQKTKSNGYYNLKDGLFEELKYGIINYDYKVRHRPVIKGELNINLYYQKSDKSFAIQAADLVAGTTRRININDEQIKLEYIDYLLYIPDKKKSH